MTQAGAPPHDAPMSDDLGQLSAYLETRSYGRVHEHHPELGSTNDRATERMGSLPHGAVITADAQTAGRGRMGRSWSSPPGQDLYVSVVLHPGKTPAGIGALGLAVGAGLRLGLVRAAEPAELPVQLKWPNDLLVGGRKLGGILCETRWQGGKADVVVGFGINVHRRDFDPDLAALATSLDLELGAEAPTRAPLLAALLGGLEEVVERFFVSGFPGVRPVYEPYCSLLGKTVRLPMTRPDGSEEIILATAEGLEADGALRVRSAGGGAAFRVENADVWLADRGR